MKCTTALLPALILLGLSGCTADHVRKGMYEGIRVRNDLQSSPSERLGKTETPDYDTYQRMRK